jgi:hypothetical protein
MKDLTIIYYTANKINPFFAENVRAQLASAAGEIPIVSVSQKPLKFGKNICVGEIGRSLLNIYRQVYTGAKEANTKYVAMAEDDILYPARHFTTYTPKDDEFAYDMCKWSIYTWTRPPIYSYKNRPVNSTMICPTKLLIETLEERFAKYPKSGLVYSEPGRYERHFGLTPRKLVEFWSHSPCVIFGHEDALGYEIQGQKKALGELRAFDIPEWGKASDLIKKIYGT